MKIFTYQKKGSASGKVEMEDRITVNDNTLSSGFHYLESVNGGIFAVFDGVGGLKGSSFASSCASRALADLAPLYGSEIVKNTLLRIHKELVEHSRTATTATGICISDNGVYLFHIGNCRLYGLYDGYIRQMTVDQTQFEEMLKSGHTVDEIPESAKCIINSCLGVKEDFFTHLVYEDFTIYFKQCSKILITSDGVHDHLSIESMETFLRNHITFESMQGLANSAITNGSEDDISILVIEK